MDITQEELEKIEFSKEDLERYEHYHDVVMLFRAFTEWKRLPNKTYSIQAIEEFMEKVKIILSYGK